jgi:hypothetical protein
MTESLKVVAAGLLVFAVYLPVAMFVHRYYVQVPRPVGDAVEMIIDLHRDEPNYNLARSYVFSVARFPDPSKIAVYENLKPLPRENFNFTPELGSYVIRFKTSDGSDPRTNGRQYWTVAAGARD